jgi:hypothetical protein
MATPIRSIPVLEGEVARRFEKEARKAEKNRGTIDISQNVKVFKAMMNDARDRGIFI